MRRWQKSWYGISPFQSTLQVLKWGHFEHRHDTREVLDVGTSQISEAQIRDIYLKPMQIPQSPKPSNQNVSAPSHFPYWYSTWKGCDLEILSQESPKQQQRKLESSPWPFASIDIERLVWRPDLMFQSAQPLFLFTLWSVDPTVEEGLVLSLSIPEGFRLRVRFSLGLLYAVGL